MIPNINLKNEMLKELSIEKIEDLFADIPQSLILKELNLPSTTPEHKLASQLSIPKPQIISFLGCGVYNHYVPSIVQEIISRTEFYSPYTPYQSETSQGSLQTIYEYQTMICELTGMEVANASLYDSATALGESVRMCHRINNKSEVIVPKVMHHEKLDVLKNYIEGLNIRLKQVDYFKFSGTINIEDLQELVTSDTCCVYIENPNFFGVFEKDICEIKELIKNALLIVGVNPITLSVVKEPGSYGADVVIGEGQILGNKLLFVSSLGIFATKKEYIRQVPGRIIGKTKDLDGKDAYCMILQTREQHIRQEKATSNICTNET